jgi:exonuclease I
LIRLHFYDALTAGRSPAEGQVIRFHSALFGPDEPPIERRFSVRLRDDVAVPIDGIENSPLSLLNLGIGFDETEFSRAVAPVLGCSKTLHIGFATTTKIDPFIRNAIYRSLLPEPFPYSHHLDLETLIRAIVLLRPAERPNFVDGKLASIARDFSTALWDSDWENENRALRVMELLTQLQISSPGLVSHAIGHSSINAIKTSLGMDQGEVADLQAVKPALVIHQTLQAKHGYGVFLPLSTDINYPDIMYMADLSCDLSDLVGNSSVSLEKLVRKTPGDGLPIVRVSLGRVPFVTQLKMVRPEDAKRLKLDGARIRENVQRLKSASRLASRMRDEPIMELPTLPTDVDHRMWAGDFSKADTEVMALLHDADYEQWPALIAKGNDMRVSELAIRILARECPAALTAEQAENWKDHVKRRGNLATLMSVEEQIEKLENVRTDYPSAHAIDHLLARLKGIAAKQ